MLAKRFAPVSMALVIALSTGVAFAAPATAEPAAKRQGVFKSLKVGFQAFREHRQAQGPGKIRMALRKLGSSIGNRMEKIGNGLERLGDRIASRSQKIAKGATKMTINVVDTGRAVGKTLVVKPAVATGKAIGKVGNALIIEPTIKVAEFVEKKAAKVGADIKAEKEQIRGDRRDNRMAKQMANGALTNAEIYRVSLKAKDGKFDKAVLKAIDMREQRAAASASKGDKDGPISLGLNDFNRTPAYRLQKHKARQASAAQ